MKKILVIGGLGFIGSNLVKELVGMGHELTVVDNYLTGSELNKIPNVTYIVGDAKDVCSLIATKNDIVFHLGEYSRVEQSFDDFNLVHENNMNGIRGVLEYCKKHNSKLIYSGSSTKFAVKDKNDFEGYQQSPYAFTKATNVELIKAYSAWFGLEYAITYFYNVYGENEISQGKYATLIAKFKEAYKQNQRFSVVLPGTQKRNFTHIKDTIAGLVLVAFNGMGDDYGIAADESYSIFDVVEMFGKNPNTDVDLLFSRKGNRASAAIVSEKTKALGWSPKYSLKEHIKEFLENVR